MTNPLRLRASFMVIAGMALISTFACAGLNVPPGSKATPTPTGVIGAIEAGTPAASPATELWTGTITSSTSRQYVSDGAVVNTCTTNWITDFDLAVDTSGNVRGVGKATLSEPRICSLDSDLVPNTQAMSASLTGLKRTDEFDLRLDVSDFEPAAAGEFGGYTLLLRDGACPGNPHDISVPFSGAGAAEAQLDLKGTMTGCGGSASDVMSNQSLVKIQYLFKCSELPADSADPILNQLCP